jgi:hypothetical protein
MSARIDLTGKRFGKLIALRFLYSKNNSAFWLVKCDCGKESEKKAKYLLNGDTTSCGCILSKDGRSNTRIYGIWQSMMTRCYNKNRRSYKDYGGKGIVVCDRWQDFNNFKDDTREGYSDELTLDRFPDRHGNYEPGNTRWADMYQQAKNKDRTKLYLFSGEMLCVPEISKITGVTAFSIYGKLAYGYSIEDAAKPKITSSSRRNSRIFIVNGNPKTIKDLSEEYGINYDKLRHRLMKKKLSVEEAISVG